MTRRPVTQRVVIVGSGIGGIRTAQALRTLGYAGQVIVVGQETEPPYDRPPLSKDFLAGRREAEGISLLSHQEAAATGISLRLGVTAERIVPKDKCLVLGHGETLAYDVCVVATGASARPSPWDKLDGVHVLRSLVHGRGLRPQLLAGREVAVIGGGFIGSEVAATARSLGLAVTVIDPLPLPLSRTLGTTVAQLVVGLHHRHGVNTVFGAGVESIENSGRRLNLRLSTGAVVAADAVVVGIGAVPNDEWLSGSGLPVSDGLLCDQYCRVQGRDDIFGVGDVVRWYSPRHDGHVRVEHWTNAVDQARCVAHNITFPDQQAAYDGIEYVWSDQYDWKIQVAGRPVHHDITTEAIAGDFDAQRPRGAVLYGDSTGALCGAVTVNWPRAIALTRRALTQRAAYRDALAAVSGLRRLPGPVAITAWIGHHIAEASGAGRKLPDAAAFWIPGPAGRRDRPGDRADRRRADRPAAAGQPAGPAGRRGDDDQFRAAPDGARLRRGGRRPGRGRGRHPAAAPGRGPDPAGRRRPGLRA